MANHSHLALSKPIVHASIGAVLAKANTEVFLGLLELKDLGEEDGWRLSVPKNDYAGCKVWKSETHKNSLALRSGPGEFSSWMEWTLLGELKAELGGRTSNEGVGSVKVPRREFPTWKSYYDMVYRNFAAKLWAQEMKSLKCPVLKALAAVK